MSNYTQVTDFSAKDALTTGDPEKAISGADVDGEFSAISTAIASKQDYASAQRNILDYNANANDGATDASVAAQAYLNAVVSAGGGEMIFPPGDYLFDSQVTASTSAQEIAIVGSGVGLTRIMVPDTNASGAFSITLSDYTSQITVKDISFMADGEACGTALEITQPVGGNRHNRTVFMTRVHIGGVDPDTDYFDVCANLTGCWRPLIDGCIFGGPFSATAIGTHEDTDAVYSATTCIDLDDSYHPEVNNSYLWSAQTGISNVSTGGGSEAEGLRISNTNIVQCLTGVKYARTAQEPTLWVTDCHINCRDLGLDINSCKLLVIKGNSFYNVDLDETHYGTPADILLDDTSAVIITNNTFHFDGPTDRINIQVLATTAADDILISNNIFNCVAANAIYVGTNATNVTIANNLFPGTYTKNVNSLSALPIIAGEDGNDKYMIQSQAGSNAAGPELTLYRDSSTPAVADSIGQLAFAGNSSAGTRRDYAAVKTVINDETDATEDATIHFTVMKAGTLTTVAQIDGVSAETSGDTTLFIYDALSNSLERVKSGANASGPGGVGRALYIDNA